MPVVPLVPLSPPPKDDPICPNPNVPIGPKPKPYPIAVPIALPVDIEPIELIAFEIALPIEVPELEVGAVPIWEELFPLPFSTRLPCGTADIIP